MATLRRFSSRSLNSGFSVADLASEPALELVGVFASVAMASVCW